MQQKLSLLDKQIRITPYLPISEKCPNYIIIKITDFTPNATNPQFRDCTVEFHIICHSDYWDLGNYRERPIKIVGLIDGILENSRLTGIGTFQMVRCDQQILSSTLSGYSLVYRAIHGSDDKLPESDKIV